MPSCSCELGPGAGECCVGRHRRSRWARRSCRLGTCCWARTPTRAQDTHKPRGKYTILTTIAEKYTTNVGHPGFANAAIDEIFNTFLVPQMFAQVAQGKLSAQDAARSAQGQFKSIFAKWKAQGLL